MCGLNIEALTISKVGASIDNVSDDSFAASTPDQFFCAVLTSRPCNIPVQKHKSVELQVVGLGGASEPPACYTGMPKQSATGATCFLSIGSKAYF